MTTDQAKKDKRQFGPIASVTQFHTSNSQAPGVLLGGQLPAQPLATDLYLPSTPPTRFSRRPKQGLSGAKVRKQHR